MEKRPLTGNFLKFCSECFHHDTDRLVAFKCREIWPTGNRWNRALLTWNKFRLALQLSLLRGSRPKSARASPLPPQYTQESECSSFYPNRFTFGSVIAERVNTAKTRRKVNPIFGLSLPLSRIITTVYTTIELIKMSQCTLDDEAASRRKPLRIFSPRWRFFGNCYHLFLAIAAYCCRCSSSVVGRSVCVSVCWSRSSATQQRLNRSICCLVGWLIWAPKTRRPIEFIRHREGWQDGDSAFVQNSLSTCYYYWWCDGCSDGKKAVSSGFQRRTSLGSQLADRCLLVPSLYFNLLSILPSFKPLQ